MVKKRASKYDFPLITTLDLKDIGGLIIGL